MNARLAKETAKAWHIPEKEVFSIVSWIEEKVPSYARSKVFTTLLRRKHEERLERRNYARPDW